MKKVIIVAAFVLMAICCVSCDVDHENIVNATENDRFAQVSCTYATGSNMKITIFVDTETNIEYALVSNLYSNSLVSTGLTMLYNQDGSPLLHEESNVLAGE